MSKNTNMADETRKLYDRLQVLEREEHPLELEERLRAMNRPLLSWYEEHARVLPWRENPEPYRVWISEIMLQQTRVEAVKPYFERFMEELPGVEALAKVEDDRLMKLWEGLGYYNRARNLKKAAQIIVIEHGGQMPSDYEELLKLPGIGSYTAGAIASIAFGLPVPAVDGNVLRVISRVTASYADILKQSTKRWMEEHLRNTMPRERTSHFNQGLIEIGAIVCVPNGEPKCMICPLQSICLAYKENRISELPVKTPPKKRRIEERTVCILECEDQVGIRKREDTGLLASLYELPNTEGHLKPEQLAENFDLKMENIIEIQPLPEAKHIFSHVEWRMIGYRVLLKHGIPKSCIAVQKEKIKTTYALPNAFGRYTKLIK
ncbi:MAG: A/G-specific adenine glycosylase [Brotaphodocola sp.]